MRLRAAVSGLIAVASLLSMFGPSPVWAEDQQFHEQLYILPPPGWIIGFHDRQGNVDLTELVPTGQSVQEWSEMLTVQIIDGKPEKSPADILKDQVGDIQKACEDVGAGPIGPRAENGYDTALRAIACTKSKKWGKGELNLYKVIRGEERLYVVSRSWRGEPFDKSHSPVPSETTRAWIAFMDQVVVCAAGDAQHPCPKTGGAGEKK